MKFTVATILLMLIYSSSSYNEWEIAPPENNRKSNMENSSIKPGFWKSADKNPFWITVIGDQVYWLGMNKQSGEKKLGENWCHVGVGKIYGNRIILNWSDIPVGEDHLNGRITVEILSETKMKVTEDSGNFGKSEWTWESDNKSFSEIGI
uniref:hypothetical protein n=1 Tax=uncultured Draconibacterium sp. TaxID=1573823 RepID=UPI003216F1F6